MFHDAWAAEDVLRQVFLRCIPQEMTADYRKSTGGDGLGSVFFMRPDERWFIITGAEPEKAPSPAPAARR